MSSLLCQQRSKPTFQANTPAPDRLTLNSNAAYLQAGTQDNAVVFLIHGGEILLLNTEICGKVWPPVTPWPEVVTTAAPLTEN